MIADVPFTATARLTGAQNSLRDPRSLNASVVRCRPAAASPRRSAERFLSGANEHDYQSAVQAWHEERQR